jgi:SAM-dependent methyltransferase
LTVLSIVRPDWRSMRIWEVAPAGPASDKLRRECPAYISSQYWPEVAPGTDVAGVRCEDLERTTLEDESIDIVVSSDVFEHIVDVDAAQAEIARVLSPTGVHVWTAPQDRARDVSTSRVVRVGSNVVPLGLAEYHGDPVNPEGTLVTFDWGRDLPERVEAASGMPTSVFRLESRVHGLLGEYLEVFVSRKQPDGPLIDDLWRRVTELQADVVRYSEEARRANGTLADVLGSRSWRLTKPMRFLASSVRRRRDRPA